MLSLCMVWTVYYDDFPALSLDCIKSNTEASLKCFMQLLGWTVDWGSAKDLPFSQIFQALGVEFRLNKLESNLVVVANKQSRIDKLVELCKDVLAKDSIASEMASELAGKFQYSEGQIFGRVARPATAVLHQVAARRVVSDMNPKVRSAIEWLALHVATARPREIVQPGAFDRCCHQALPDSAVATATMAGRRRRPDRVYPS